MDGLSEKMVFDAVWSIVTRRIADRTSAAVDLLSDILQSFGRIYRREQELVAGDRVLNDDHQILPRIARATGLGFCVYLGNRRVASVSVLEAGQAPQIGGYADAVAVETVLRRRETFRGEVERGGRLHVLACRPLFASDKDSDHGPVGIVEAFQDQHAYRDLVSTTLRELVGANTEQSEEGRAERMETVMHFIDDVARRLQLLALNGNIIAAQAGDHGRAFRVVCRELSNLADQSKDTVAEVRNLAREFERPESQASDDLSEGDVPDGELPDVKIKHSPHVDAVQGTSEPAEASPHPSRPASPAPDPSSGSAPER